MESRRFDVLVRSFSAAIARRSVLQGMLGGTLGARIHQAGASAKGGKGKAHKRTRCERKCEQECRAKASHGDCRALCEARCVAGEMRPLDCPAGELQCWTQSCNHNIGSLSIGSGRCWDDDNWCCYPCGESRQWKWSDQCNATFNQPGHDCGNHCQAVNNELFGCWNLCQA